MMGSKLRKIFQSTDADDINAIEIDINNPAVKVYDLARNSVYKVKDITAGAENITCEEICLKLSERLGIGVISSHLLGLQVSNSRNGCQKWLSPKDTVTVESGEEVFLRFRHIPTKLGCRKLTEEDKHGLSYLYFQISDDFLHEKLPLQGNIGISDALGLVTLSLLIKLRLETESRSTDSEDLNLFLKTVDVVSFVPRLFMSDSLIGKIKLNKSICQKLKSIHKSYPASHHNSKDLMKCYLEHILSKDFLKAHFYEETFKARRLVRGSELVDVAVQVDKGINVPVVQLISEHSRVCCPIKDLSSLDISQKSTDSQDINQSSIESGSFYKVQIGRVTGIPEIVYFPSEADAKSFVSCLESLSRLTCDYYGSLCQTVAPDWFREMLHAGVHGPSSTDYLDRVLQVKSKCREDRYILYKSQSDYNTYKICFYNKKKKVQNILIGKVEHSDSGYKLQGQTIEPTRDLKTLLRKAVISNNLVTSNSFPIRPQAEVHVCDTVYKLLQDGSVPRLLEEDEIEEQDRKKLELQPKVYLPGDLQIQGSIGQGYFTDVHKAVLNEEESVIVKSLRLPEIPSEYQHVCFKALQDGMTKLMTLDYPSCFTGFVGMCLDSSTRMILKETEFGNLKDFLRHRDPSTTLHQQHLNEATLCVANALLFMEQKKLFHGNINCSNIVVAKYDSGTLGVKLTDPGLVTLYNKLPLDHVVNRNRVPWLSPKLFDNLTVTTLQTDVYAFGTTVWEMFNNGWGPLDVGQQLHDLRHDEVTEFFRSGKHLNSPVYLVKSKSDPDRMKTIKKKIFEMVLQCWETNEEEMLLPDRIVRDLNQILGSYGKYHEYDVIPYSDGWSSSPQPLDVTSGRPGQVALMYQHKDKQVPDLSCLNSPDLNQTTPKTVFNEPGTDQDQTTPNEGPSIDPDQTIPKTLFDGPGKDQDQTTPKTLQIEAAVKESVQKVAEKHDTTHIKTDIVQPRPENRNATTAFLPTRPPSQNGPQSLTALMTGANRKLPAVKNINYLIAEQRLTLDKTHPLGQGYYGTVFKGNLMPLSSTGLSSPIPVAVKCLKEEMLDRFADDFRKEIAVMETLEHTNIVKFYGVCKGERYIVMECLDGGSLHSYVSKQRIDSKVIPTSLFVSLSLDIAKGMEYLWSKKVLHMDLACRNILLKKLPSDKKLCAKVSDFGLSKVLGLEKDYYRRMRGREKTIPVLWCALEWLGQSRFTTKCDVWSFGVTVWEMCSYGKKPNICETEQQFVQQGYHRLKKGERLPQPPGCLAEIYQLMRDCWEETPERRPEFTDCVARLSEMSLALTSKSENQSGTRGGSGGPAGDSQKNDDKSGHLQKLGSQNSATESGDDDTDDYQKMAAGRIISDDSSGQKQTGREQVALQGEAAPAEQATTSTLIISNQKKPSIAAASAELTGTQELMVAKPTTAVSSTGLSAGSKSSKTFSQSNNRTGYFLEESDVDVTDICLGQGSFGIVKKGILRDKKNSTSKEVAVKTVNASEESRRFKREMQLLGTVSHPNIVQFIGCIKGSGGSKRYAMELMEKGNLTNYLSEHGKDIHLTTRLGFLLDIAQGMSYLAEKSILHCDLTAANVLLSHDLTAKISDLGFSKLLEQGQSKTESGFYKRENAKFKLLWSAQEVFSKEVYTRTSDVWSYGVLCVEVFLNGREIIFNGRDHKYWDRNIHDYAAKMKNGDRFERPDGCPGEVYDLMKNCWSWLPEERPTFDTIVKKMGKLKDDLKS